MKTIPRYWAYVKSDGGLYVWRSSPTSEDDARNEAQKAAKRLNNYENVHWTGNRPPQDAYPYGVTFREKLLDEFHDSNDELQAFITRNHAGAEVLNVRDVMFLDWDLLPEPKKSVLAALFRRLFRRKVSENTERTPEPWEELYPWATAPELKAFMSQIIHEPHWSVRIYQTAAGFRGVVTHALFDPCDSETIRRMQDFQCDPMYVRLCKHQESFRARLTPKGWRCGLWPNKSTAFRFYYPYHHYIENCWTERLEGIGEVEHSGPVWHIGRRDGKFSCGYKKAEPRLFEENLKLYTREYDAAVERYEEAAKPFATCRYLGTVGSGAIHPDIQRIIALHDQMTGVLDSEEKPLA